MALRRRSLGVPLAGGPDGRGQSMQDDTARGRALGRRYTLAVFGIVTGAFVIATTWQITAAVFGGDAAPLSGTSAEGNARGGSGPGVPPGGCEGDLRALHAAAERAIVASATAPDEEGARRAYRAALAPEWDGLGATRERCAPAPHGGDALAAVERFRQAGEELAMRRARDLGPMRKDLAAYLPPDGLPR